jgi:hypothetical protein
VYMELGASKKINEKLIVRFSANDPFGLDQLHVHNDAGNFKENTVYRYASRLFSASLTYSFGKKTNEDRQPKDIEEARRL